MRLFSSCVLLSLALTSCASVDYKPLAPANFDDLVAQGCRGVEQRFSIDAQVSAAFKETVVLWNGVDARRTVAVRLPSEGLGSKARGLVGQSRYEVNLETLRGLNASDTPAVFTLECVGKDKAPEMVRLRYVQDGQTREIEFQ